MPETSIQTPEWVKDAIFYQIFPDTFARSTRVPKPGGIMPWDTLPGPHGYKGGDLLGVLEHLDYLIDLGINAIYFCPIFQSASNHRYHTHDYLKVDPMLGGDAALRELLDAAHARGVRIVLDGVFNHASRGFFQFNDILENGLKSAYVDWFIIKDKNKPLDPYNARAIAHGQSKWKTNYQCWWDLPPLPKFNTNNPEVREFLWGVAEHWIRFGIDGWRLDVPTEIDDEPFWQEFRRRVKAANPEAYIVGEIWHPAPEWLRGDRFDAVMNYVFNRAVQGFFGGDKLDTRVRPGGYRLRPLNAKEFAAQIEEMIAMYPWEVTQVQLNLLGSHDTPRILSILGHDRDRLKLAFLFQMTMPGAPCIYYGDEIGMRSVAVEGHEGRMTMTWNESRWDMHLHSAVKQFAALRHKLPALRRGSFETLYVDNRYNVYSFIRRYQDETVVVLFNNGSSPFSINIGVKDRLPEGARLESQLDDAVCTVSHGRLTGGPLPPHSGGVLKVV